MAVSASNLTIGSATGSLTSQATASISPSANKLILLRVYTRTGTSTEPNQPTATGNGLTWVVVNSIYFDTDSSSRKKLTVFRAMGASPSSGAITIDLAGQTQTDIGWVVDEFTGMDTSGTNGSGAIVQSVAAKDESGSGGTLTVTLGAFSNSGNATYGAFASDSGDTTVPTVGTGFTGLAVGYDSTTQSEYVTEFRNDNDVTVDATMPTTAGIKLGGIAIEIAAATTGVTVKTLASLGVG